MHKGQLREMGTHQELLAQRGLYWKLYRLQYKDQEIPDAAIHPSEPTCRTRRLSSDQPTMPSTPQIFLSAGEASGERYGAMLIEAVRAARPDAEFFGLGGTAMEAAGCERIVRAEDIAVMGITEVLRHMPRIYARVSRAWCAAFAPASRMSPC